MEVIKGSEPTGSSNKSLPIEMKETAHQVLAKTEMASDLGLPEEALNELDLNDSENEKDELSHLFGDDDSQPDAGADSDDDSVGEPDEIDELKKELQGDEEDEEDSKESKSDKDVTFEIDGEKVSLEDIRGWKSGAMMERDYRQKTMALSQERKEIEQQRSQMFEEYQQATEKFENEMNLLKQLDAFFTYKQQNEPDYYNDIVNDFTEFQKQMSNPVLESQTRKMKEEMDALKARLEQRDTAAAEQELKMGLREVKAYAKKFKDLGLKWDEEAVAKEWANSSDSPLKCFKRLYGDTILTLAESKKKLGRTAKAVKQTPNIGQVKGADRVVPKSLDERIKGMRNMHEITEAILSGGI